MTQNRNCVPGSTWLVLAVMLSPVLCAAEEPVEGDVVLRALVDELARSMELQLEDLEKPYLIQYKVEDRTGHWLAATHGAITQADRTRRRSFSSRVRVGGYDLDNTNFVGGSRGGTRTSLPVDDDYVALRQGIWTATDRQYKGAVEALTRKRSYLEQKNIEDRPPDYTAAEPVTHLQSRAELKFDEATWRQRLEVVSGRFGKYPAIQNSEVSLVAGVVTDYTVNSEGTRLRVSDTGILLTLRADLQATDGMRLGDQRVFGGESFAELPTTEELVAAVDELCASLAELATAPILEEYTGPVLFEARAAGQVLASLLAPGLAGRPDPIGAPGRSDDSLEKKLGKRILPRTFQVQDDPTVKRVDGKLLFGWYDYDAEGVPARRVQLVADGMLETMVMSRTPTRKIQGTTGHGRNGRFGADAQATTANLFVSDEAGLEDDELKQALIEACQDEDLEFGLRITALDNVGSGYLSDPVFAYRVYVEDGREELIRGVEFRPVEVRALRRILAAGKNRHVLNYFTPGSGLGAAVVAPALLFDELELSKVEEEFDKLPILDAPATREDASAR